MTDAMRDALTWALAELRGETRYANEDQRQACFAQADAALARPAAPTQSAAQTGNTRRTIIVDGLSLVDYCRANGLPYEGTQARLRRGYPLAIAISPLTGGEFRRMVRKEMER